jgi:hypothetical protein
MGTRSSTPDLFSPTSVREPFSSPTNSPAASSKVTASSRHILPADLPRAIKQLDDQELDRLLAAVLAEHKRRGRKPFASDQSSRKRQVEVPPSLTQGQLNVVRAAFKAGVTPSRIARQFGISQSDVRKALAGDASKR